MSKRKGFAVVASGLAFAAAGLIYLYTRQANAPTQKKIKNARDIPRQTVLKILKEISKDSYAVFQNLAMISNQIKDQSKGRVPVSELREYLINQNKTLKNQIKEIADSVFAKFGCEEKDVKYACEVTYKDDPDVKTLLSDARSVLEKAVNGIPPDNKTDIPAFLTPKRVLELLCKIMQESLKKIRSSFQDLRAEGVEISINNPKILMTLQNLKLEDLRRDTLNEAGLDKFDDPASKIFQFATQKYTTENPDRFYEKLMQLEKSHQKAMDLLLKSSDGVDQMIDGLEQIIAQAAWGVCVCAAKAEF